MTNDITILNKIIEEKIKEEEKACGGRLDHEDKLEIRIAVYTEAGILPVSKTRPEDDRFMFDVEEEEVYGGCCAEDFSGCGMTAAEFSWRYQM